MKKGFLDCVFYTIQAFMTIYVLSMVMKLAGMAIAALSLAVFGAQKAPEMAAYLGLSVGAFVVCVIFWVTQRRR